MAKRTHYVNKKELNEEIKKYKETGVVSKELGCMLRKIAEHYARHPNFRGYQRINMQEDLISEAIIMSLKALKSYNPYRTDKEPNPLSYFTEVSKNAFCTFLKKHYKNENFKREMLADYCHENGIPFVDVVGEDLADRKAEKERKNEGERDEEI